MESPNIPYNPRIDQLRWLAASIVFLYHFNLEFGARAEYHVAGPWWGLVTQGHTGVALFFTLSGFLFMQIALRQRRIAYGEFLRSRVLRIFPLFATIFLLATSISRDAFQPQDLLYILATNLGLAPTSATVVTGAAWTISLEFTFYLLFPFLARFTLERGAGYLLGLLVMMLFMKLAAFSVSGPKATLMYFSTFVGRFDQFLIGMLAALGYARYRDRLHALAPLIVLAGSAAAFLASALLASVAPFQPQSRNAFWIYWSFIESSAWAILIVGWISFTANLPGWIERLLIQGGKISFSFYLLHMAVLHTLSQLAAIPSSLSVPGALTLLAASYALTWALSTLSYATIEEPFLRLRRRYGPMQVAPHGASGRNGSRIEPANAAAHQADSHLSETSRRHLP